MRVFLNILLGITMTAITLWGVGALYFSPLLPARWRAVAAASYGTASILAFALLPWPGRTAIAALAIFAVLVILFLRIPASNDRDWQPDVSVTPHATVNGDLVTIHGVRNFDYRSESDFTPRWEDRTYDLRKLDSADIIAVYWAGKAVAHIMVSFGFQDQDYLAVSIETRKEKGESYSTLAGFFRRYELYYVVADERDVIRVRTTYRQPQEDVYIYRMRVRQIHHPADLSRLHSGDERHVCASALLQYTDDQLHDDHSHAHADESRVAADVVESFAERLCTRLSLQTRPHRYGETVCRLGKALPRERTRARGRQRCLLLATPQARAAEAGAAAVVRESDGTRHRATCSSIASTAISRRWRRLAKPVFSKSWRSAIPALPPTTS